MYIYNILYNIYIYIIIYIKYDDIYIYTNHFADSFTCKTTSYLASYMTKLINNNNM